MIDINELSLCERLFYYTDSRPGIRYVAQGTNPDMRRLLHTHSAKIFPITHQRRSRRGKPKYVVLSAVLLKTLMEGESQEEICRVLQMICKDKDFAEKFYVWQQEPGKKGRVVLLKELLKTKCWPEIFADISFAPQKRIEAALAESLSSFAIPPKKILHLDDIKLTHVVSSIYPDSEYTFWHTQGSQSNGTVYVPLSIIKDWVEQQDSIDWEQLKPKLKDLGDYLSRSGVKMLHIGKYSPLFSKLGRKIVSFFMKEYPHWGISIYGEVIFSKFVELCPKHLSCVKSLVMVTERGNESVSDFILNKTEKENIRKSYRVALTKCPRMEFLYIDSEIVAKEEILSINRDGVQLENLKHPAVINPTRILKNFPFRVQPLRTPRLPAAVLKEPTWIYLGTWVPSSKEIIIYERDILALQDALSKEGEPSLPKRYKGLSEAHAMHIGASHIELSLLSLLLKHAPKLKAIEITMGGVTNKKNLKPDDFFVHHGLEVLCMGSLAPSASLEFLSVMPNLKALRIRDFDGNLSDNCNYAIPVMRKLVTLTIGTMASNDLREGKIKKKNIQNILCGLIVSSPQLREFCSSHDLLYLVLEGLVSSNSTACIRNIEYFSGDRIGYLKDVGVDKITRYCYLLEQTMNPHSTFLIDKGQRAFPRTAVEVIKEKAECWFGASQGGGSGTEPEEKIATSRSNSSHSTSSYTSSSTQTPGLDITFALDPNMLLAKSKLKDTRQESKSMQAHQVFYSLTKDSSPIKPRMNRLRIYPATSCQEGSRIIPQYHYTAACLSSKGMPQVQTVPSLCHNFDAWQAHALNIARQKKIDLIQNELYIAVYSLPESSEHLPFLPQPSTSPQDSVLGYYVSGNSRRLELKWCEDLRQPVLQDKRKNNVKQTAYVIIARPKQRHEPLPSAIKSIIDEIKKQDNVNCKRRAYEACIRINKLTHTAREGYQARMAGSETHAWIEVFKKDDIQTRDLGGERASSTIHTHPDAKGFKDKGVSQRKKKHGSNQKVKPKLKAKEKKGVSQKTDVKQKKSSQVSVPQAQQNSQDEKKVLQKKKVKETSDRKEKQIEEKVIVQRAKLAYLKPIAPKPLLTKDVMQTIAQGQLQFIMSSDAIHAAKVVQAAALQSNTACYVATSPDELRCTGKGLQLQASDQLDISAKGDKLAAFLNQRAKPGKRRVVLIPLGPQFSARDMVALNRLLQAKGKRYISGYAKPIPNDVTVVLVGKSPYEGADFYSRIGASNIYSLKPGINHLLALKKPVPVKQKDTLVLDLYNNRELWRSYVEGRLQMNQRIKLEVSPLLRLCRGELAGIKHMVFNNPPGRCVEFELFLQQLKKTRCFTVYGQKFKLPKGVTIKTSTGYRWAQYKGAGTLVSLNKAPRDAAIIRQGTVHYWLSQVHFSKGILHTKPGLIELAAKTKDRILKLHLGESLGAHHMAELLSAALHHGVKLEFSYAPGVLLSKALVSALSIKDTDKKESKEKKAVLPKRQVLISKRPIAAAEALKQLLSREQKLTAEDIWTCALPESPEALFYQLTRLADEKKVAAKTSSPWRFKRSLGDVGKVLFGQGQIKSRPKAVILRGPCSPQMADALANLLHRGVYRTYGEEHRLTIPLYVVTDKSNEADFKMLPCYKVEAIKASQSTMSKKTTTSSAMEVKRLSKAELIKKASWQLKELKELEASLPQNEREETKRNTILQGLRSKHAVFLQGDTGAGKTTLMRQWQQAVNSENQDATRPRFFFGVGNAKAWAAAKSKNPKAPLILVLDEVNLGGQQALEAALGELPNGHVYIGQQHYHVGAQHRVVVMGNPASYGSRELPAIVKHHAQIIDCPALSPRFLYQKVLKPALSFLSTDAEKLRISRYWLDVYKYLQGLSEHYTYMTGRELGFLAALWAYYHKQAKEKPEAIAQWLVYRMTKQILPPVLHNDFNAWFTGQGYQMQRPQNLAQPRWHDPNFHLAPECEPVLRLLEEQWALKEKMYCPRMLTLEGESAAGKTTLVKSFLRQRDYIEQPLLKHSKPNVGGKYFYHLGADLPEVDVMYWLRRAHNESLHHDVVVVVDEINTLSVNLQELFKLLDTGKAAEKNAKLMIIGTQNSVSCGGRRLPGNAEARRQQLMHIEPYSQQSLETILWMTLCTEGPWLLAEKRRKDIIAEQVQGYLDAKYDAECKGLPHAITLRGLLQHTEQVLVDENLTLLGIGQKQQPMSGWQQIRKTIAKRKQNNRIRKDTLKTAKRAVVKFLNDYLGHPEDAGIAVRFFRWVWRGLKMLSRGLRFILGFTRSSRKHDLAVQLKTDMLETNNPQDDILQAEQALAKTLITFVDDNRVISAKPHVFCCSIGNSDKRKSHAGQLGKLSTIAEVKSLLESKVSR